MKKTIMATAGAIALAAVIGGPVLADPPFDPKDPKFEKYISGDKRSGYTFAEPETRDMQDDDFTNPGFLWVEKGEKLWSKADGAANKACSDCHGKAEVNMKGVGASYPKYDVRAQKVVNVEQRINMCREDHMGAKAWKWESDPLLSMTTYVKHQSRGMPVSVQVDGAAAPYFEAGRRFYYERRGLNDLACKHCHEDNWGGHMRSELLSQGQTNGFPTYRLKWQKLGSLHKRLAGCNQEIRAEPYEKGGPEYTNLELFLAWRSQGLTVETPSVRK